MSDIIQPGDLAKVQAIFPGKFIFVYVADHATKKADLAGTAQKPEDVSLLKTLIHRVTLGDNGQPKGKN